MEYRIKNKFRYITLLPALLLLVVSLQSRAQCTQWYATVSTEGSSCAANGRITVTLKDTVPGSLSGIQYRLNPVTNSFSVAPNEDHIFNNVPSGTYDIIVSAICNANTVYDTVRTVVTGDYKSLTGTSQLLRNTLHNCNTGIFEVILEDGSIPDSLILTSFPAAYTGPTRFLVDVYLEMENLPAGTYSMYVKDACGTTDPLQNVVVAELPVMTSTHLSMNTSSVFAGATCNQIKVNAPSLSGVFNGYSSAPGPLTYSVRFDTMAKSAYLPFADNSFPKQNYTTINLPGGLSFNDTYGKVITYYVKSPCGEEASGTYTVTPPNFNTGYVANCTVSFEANYNISGLYCAPVYISIKNNATNEYRYDTLRTSASGTTKGLAFGEYTLAATTVDGYVFSSHTMKVDVPVVTNPYSISKTQYNGRNGNDGAGFFTISKSGGSIAAGVTVKLISSPAPGSTYEATTTATGTSIQILRPTTGTSYFYPGDYLFRVTDGCSTYDLPVTLNEFDVYRFSWEYTTEQTCDGLKFTPTGKGVYQGANVATYFKIVGGVYTGGGFIPSGGSFIFPTPGRYIIGISASATQVGSYGTNTKVYIFDYKPLAVNIDSSIGWVCPGQPSNSGSIIAKAINGSKAATGVYTYRLATAGNGATGPYLESNTTGRFNSNGSYNLIANQNYDVRVEDECGAGVVQTIKILDFQTAQLASSDKPEYCIGENIQFKIINLPDSAIRFAWTGPNGFGSSLQNPIRYNIKPADTGNYHVVISSDICQQPIISDVKVKLAPYITTCYSAVTDTSVNPYAYGLLGNWHPMRSYAYYGPRKESDPAAETDIRHDGTFKNFTAFWQVQTKKWSAHKDTTKWVWNAESSIFNSKGFELENRDPLGRYNSGIYGYDNAIPVAVIQNSRYCEAAFEGFEDYGFDSNVCDATCSSGRRFDFSFYKSKIDSSRHHTGRYSIRVQPGDTVGIMSTVLDKAVDLTEPAFNKGADSCSTSGAVLKSVRADAGSVLPSFTPLSGKKILFSAWVFEAQDCSSGSYKDNKVVLAVKNTSGNTQTLTVTPTGNIIEGWQRYEQVIELPAGSTDLSVILLATGTAKVYFDDIRIHPYNANMKSFVYDATTLRMMAELDENNYATFYEYDDDGTLTRVKKETERGIKTIRETRSALIKE